ncbi:MAG TPA: IPT/TIG domain-containing protein [Blastocatellia bacterium]|nr:IPT/TIG domain-containing protein [Blastocatellia bacterium]
MSDKARMPSTARGIIYNQELKLVKPNRKVAITLSCLLLASLIVVQGSDNRAKLGQTRSVSLPAFAVLDERAEPLIAANGKVGFVSSVTAGALIAFNTSSGKILSSMVVGETAGPISMIETDSVRLIAIPAANDPANGNPATVSIIDATRTKHPDLKSLLVLPANAMITPATRAVLTRDGKFCLVASSFNEPALYSFDIETGQIVSQLPLAGRPSEMAFFDEGERRMIAVASSAANTLSIIKIDERGQLSALSGFTPAGARFDIANNPAFSADGRMVYIAASTGDQLFMIDAESGIQIDMASVAAPQRVSVARGADGMEIVAASRIRRPANGKPGGVSIIKNQNGRFKPQSEFTPPEGIEFSRANNVAFTADGATAFVGSTTGVLFAFSAETGELESYNAIGGELRSIALNENTHTVAAIRSSTNGDEIAIINFDMVSPGEPDPTSPAIEQLQPEVVEQGRLNNAQITIVGRNFTDGASLIINGVEVAADLAQNGRALQAKLPKSLFDQPAAIAVRVKGASGALSDSKLLRVARPDLPIIESIRPTQVPAPSNAFTLRVRGKNFRASSTIVVAGHALTTQMRNGELQAVVPVELARSVGSLKVQIKDLAVADLASANEKEIAVFGPRISSVQPRVSRVVAGDGGFSMMIRGENLRSDSQVTIGDRVIPDSRVHYINRSLLRVDVPRELYQDAGKLAVTVRDSVGNASAPAELEVRGPEIQTIAPGKLYAGESRATVVIRGQNFRRRARVYVGNASAAYRVAPRRVRFINSRRIIVTLDGELAKLLAQAGELRFKVVNPNSEDGVPSADKPLSVVAPAINDSEICAQGGEPYVTIAIDGANFRRGAIVEFIKGGAVVRQQTPVSVTENQLLVTIESRKVEALGSFSLRVVNPGSVASDAAQPRLNVAAASND